MLNTIKPYNKEFNLLYLDNNEFIINTINTYGYNSSTKKFNKGKLHLNTRSLIMQPDNINEPLLKLKFSEWLTVKMLTLEDILNYNKYNNEIILSNREKQAYSRNTIFKKKSSIQTSNKYNFNPQSTPHQNNMDINVPKSTRKSFKNSTTQNNLSNIVSNHNHFYSIQMINFNDIINKVIHDGIINSKTTNNNLNITSTLTDIINKNNKNLSNHILDLIGFFNDQNLNLQNFCDFFSYIHNNFIKEDKLKNTKFYFIIAKINRTHIINRNPVANYETILQPRTHLFIIESDDRCMRNFLEDRKFIMDNLFKSLDDIYQFNLFVNKKISELSEYIDKILGNEEENNKIMDTVKSEKQNDIKLLQSINLKEENNKILYKCKVIRILPEGIQHGLLLIIRDGWIEFRPVTNNYKNNYFKSQFTKVKALVNYRYLYKNKALNIHFYQSRRSKIFNFENDKEYKEVFNILDKNCTNIDRTYTDIKYHTKLWTNGLISNYDYILYLNFMASRSFSDLSQYPVFPWIIINYDSDDEFEIGEVKNYRDLNKPIGALNPDKFEIFFRNYKNRSNSNNEPLYLYPSHYSSPMIVIYYLTRALPQYQLHLQGGSFGPVERMFNNINELWNYIYSHGREVHELIPEFYSSNGEFLLNIHNIPLSKNNNNPINDTNLPNWAKSAQDFINVNRASLESEYVSSNLNNWIDLIFGYKQRGDEAEAADNLFNYVTYDNFSYESDNELKTQALITEIKECGQIPKQLFTEPHPKKKSANYLDYLLLKNPQEEMKIKIEYLKKENLRLEKNFSKLENEKFTEKELIVKNYKEIDKKRVSIINSLKEQIKEKEKEFKLNLEKLNEQNIQLKMKFENIDNDKELFYQQIIEKLRLDHQKYIDSKFSNQHQLYDYIKSLEISINKSKLSESSEEEKYIMLVKNLEKMEKKNNNLEEQVNVLKRKLHKIPK